MTKITTGPEKRKEAARLANALDREAKKSLTKGLSLSTVQQIMTDANSDLQAVKMEG